MWRFIKFLCFLPIALVVVGVAMANRQEVSIFLDPTGRLFEQPVSFPVPLYLLVFGCLIVGIIIGGWAAWLTQGKNRRQKTEYRQEVEKLKYDLSVARRS